MNFAAVQTGFVNELMKLGAVHTALFAKLAAMGATTMMPPAMAGGSMPSMAAPRMPSSIPSDADAFKSIAGAKTYQAPAHGVPSTDRLMSMARGSMAPPSLPPDALAGAATVRPAAASGVAKRLSVPATAAHVPSRLPSVPTAAGALRPASGALRVAGKVEHAAAQSAATVAPLLRRVGAVASHLH